MTGLPADFGVAHAVAIALLFVLWVSYGPIMRVVFNGSLNRQLITVRAAWLTASLYRAQRPFDAILLGHMVNSITFFGSATMLVLAGAASLVVNATGVHAAMLSLYQEGAPSLGLFVIVVAVLNVVLAVTFFSFTYALRKLIYVLALVGALPERAEDELRDSDRHEMVAAASIVLTEALTTFNFGIRGYYYAVAALGLLIAPLVSIGLSVVFTTILLYRQVFSPTARAIGRYVDKFGTPPR